MPTYEYKCNNNLCSKEWEETQSIKECAIDVCPFCKESSAKRLISKSTFVLQGGGWYKEGYSTK